MFLNEIAATGNEIEWSGGPEDLTEQGERTDRERLAPESSNAGPAPAGSQGEQYGQKPASQLVSNPPLGVGVAVGHALVSAIDSSDPGRLGWSTQSR